ncbi:MAG: Bro-N domain-containing protein [bacterium]|nr:Bro-N domain-containing protein [bacterium]
MNSETTAIILFDGTEIRRVWHNDEWYYAIVDVIEAVTGSTNPTSYWGKMKNRETQLGPNWHKLKFVGRDGKNRFTECANREELLRIIQSIPSPKAEPFKLWLAKTGHERLEEMEDPELILERLKETYRQKGYTEEWIELRIQSIVVRQELTDEWKARDVQEGREFAILTSEISKGTFGITPSEHSKLKSLKRENLRDHMSNLELVFTSLGEVATTEITRVTDSQGFSECKTSAQRGGKVAGDARRLLEAETGEKVVTSENFLPDVQEKPKRLKKKND